MSTTHDSRLLTIDVARGVGILLVVLGHNTMFRESSPGLYEAIYLFHMPLFFFLSGLFLFRSATQSSPREFISDRVGTIVYPYLVWSITTVLLKAALGPIPNTPRGLSDLLRIPYSPIEQFWFRRRTSTSPKDP